MRLNEKEKKNLIDFGRQNFRQNRVVESEKLRCAVYVYVSSVKTRKENVKLFILRRHVWFLFARIQ